MSTTPLRMESRSESAEKRWGSQESMAMLAMTRGPSTKPVCAATKRSAPSERSATQTKACPTGRPPTVHASANFSNMRAFIVLCPSGSGLTWRSR